MEGNSKFKTIVKFKIFVRIGDVYFSFNTVGQEESPYVTKEDPETPKINI